MCCLSNNTPPKKKLGEEKGKKKLTKICWFMSEESKEFVEFIHQFLVRFSYTEEAQMHRIPCQNLLESPSQASPTGADTLLPIDEWSLAEKIGNMDYGCPSRPFYVIFSLRLFRWMHGECPNLWPPMDLLNEVSNEPGRMMDLSSKVARFAEIYVHHCCLNDVTYGALVDLMIGESGLGRIGILSLLGMRRTLSTIDELPPDRETLLEAFCRKHCPRSLLSVGARALSKVSLSYHRFR